MVGTEVNQNNSGNRLNESAQQNVCKYFSKNLLSGELYLDSLLMQ